MNGKGRGPEKGRDMSKFRSGWDGINWGKKKPIPRAGTIRVQQTKVTATSPRQ